MEGLLNFIVVVQLTIGPMASVNELDLIPRSAEPVVLGVYLPVFVAYTQSPTLEVALDGIMSDYSALVRGWRVRKPDHYNR